MLCLLRVWHTHCTNEATSGTTAQPTHPEADAQGNCARLDPAMRDCSRRCVYCGTALEYDRATLDHVHPLAKGGTHSPGNVVSACPPCNRLKADMLPAEFFLRYPWAGSNFILYARAVHRALKRQARRAVSLAFAEARAA